MDLLNKDLFSASQTASRLIKSYQSLPVNVRQALINAVYRGEMRSKDNTVKLMNAVNGKQLQMNISIDKIIERVLVYVNEWIGIENNF
jgi:hypothetical protein